MNEIKKYLDIVCEQIRFQKAHDTIKKELQDHITDQAEAFIQEGIEEQKAYELAVCEMGDPVIVGTELDRVHRPKLQWSILLFVILLSLAHITIPYLFFRELYYDTSLFQNSVILLIYIGIMLLFYRIDFTVLANHGKLFYVIYITLLTFCNFFTWTSGYFLSMDLSEHTVAVMGEFTDIYYVLHGTLNNEIPIKLPVLLYFFPIILVGLLYHYRGKSYKALFLCCSSIFPVLYFYYYHFLKTPCIVISVVCFLLLLLSISKNWFAVKKNYAVLIVCAVTILVVLFLLLLNSADYGISDAYYEYIKKIQTILQSNIKGSCLIAKGKSIFIQNDNGLLVDGFDFIKQFIEYFPAYLLHYGGWLILLPVLAIYFFFIVKTFLLLKKQKSQLGFMTATAIELTFFVISIWNIVSNSGLFVIENPLGIPFFSTSSSVNIVFFALIGILLSVFRTGHMTTDKYIKQYKKGSQKLISFSQNNIYICIPIPFSKNKKTSKNH